MGIGSELSDRFKAELTAKIIAVISSGILTVILARLLDPDGYGLLFLAISVLGVAELFSKLGIAKSTARYIANYKETDPSQITHILKFGFLLNILTVIIVCLAFFFGHEHIAVLIGEPDLIPFLFIGVLYIFFHTLSTFFRITLQGFEAIKASATLHSIDKLFRLFFAVGLVLIGYGALGALIGYIMAFLLASLFGMGYVYVRYYREPKRGQREPGLRRRIAEYMVPLTATGTADVLDKRVDMILLGFFIGPTAVAFYTIGKQVVTFIETPMSALGFTLSPTYEAQKAQGSADSAARIYEEALSHGLLLYIPAAAGLVLVSEPLIEIFFGSQYLGAVPVLQILAIYAILQSVTKLTSNGLDYLGRARERAIVKGITAILNVILNVILIPTIGVVGAALSTVVTYSMYTLANVYIINLELSLRTDQLLRHTGAALFVSAVMSGVVYGSMGLVNGIVSLFAVVGLGVAVWAVLVVGMGLLDTKCLISLLS
jgi:O-antigen/teichoic acid export membrane protein